MRGAGGRPEVEGTVVRLVLVDLCLFIPRKTLVRAYFEETLCSVQSSTRPQCPDASRKQRLLEGFL